MCPLWASVGNKAEVRIIFFKYTFPFKLKSTRRRHVKIN